MNTTGNHGEVRGDDAVEALLEKAQPRPAPPDKDEAMIREAVQKEWQTVTGKLRTRRRLVQFSVAATVLLGVAISFNMLQGSGVAPVQVATISNSHGLIYLHGENDDLHELTGMTAIAKGETIITDDDSGLALEWGKGGSLRIAENTRIDFVADDEVYLRTGTVYFDSTPSELIAAISGGSAPVQFFINTDHGRVAHVGTQFMTHTANGELKVTVREGLVNVEGTYHDETARAGQQLSIVGSARASVTNFPRHGEAWRWIEETAPVASTDGRTVHEMLNWVARETGLEIEYPDKATQDIANQVVLNGTVDLAPRAALDFWLPAQNLEWELNETGGTIKVSGIDGSSGQ